jgi:hypothetical protein
MRKEDVGDIFPPPHLSQKCGGGNTIGNARRQVMDYEEIMAVAQRNYENGGDAIVECFDREDCEKEFKTIEDVKQFCRLRWEQWLNCRFGDEEPKDWQWVD